MKLHPAQLLQPGMKACDQTIKQSAGQHTESPSRYCRPAHCKSNARSPPIASPLSRTAFLQACPDQCVSPCPGLPSSRAALVQDCLCPELRILQVYVQDCADLVLEKGLPIFPACARACVIQPMNTPAPAQDCYCTKGLPLFGTLSSTVAARSSGGERRCSCSGLVLANASVVAQASPCPGQPCPALPWFGLARAPARKA